MAKKFEVGKHYSMHSPCDTECIWTYKVIARTEKTVTLENREGIKKCRVSVSPVFDAESCTPLGRYSMSPILTAEKTVEDTASAKAFEQMKAYAEQLATSYGLNCCEEKKSTFWADFGATEYTWTNGHGRDIRVELRSRFGSPRLDLYNRKNLSAIELQCGSRPTGKYDKYGHEEYEHDCTYRPSEIQAWGAGGLEMVTVMWEELSELIHTPTNDYIEVC